MAGGLRRSISALSTMIADAKAVIKLINRGTGTSRHVYLLYVLLAGLCSTSALLIQVVPKKPIMRSISE
jgi:hypothetical protein